MPGPSDDERRPVWVPACHILQHPRQPLLQRLLGISGDSGRSQQLSQVLTSQDLQNHMQQHGSGTFQNASVNGYGGVNNRAIREGFARWVCGDDTNWVPCWACQEKICDVCKFSKLLTPPATEHGCYSRCEICFSLHVELNAALPRCDCLPDSRPIIEFTDFENTPRELCKDCVRLPDYMLLEMRKEWETRQGYDYSEAVWCCDCGIGQAQMQMFWSCDRCSGQCFDLMHVPARMPR